MSCFDCLLSRCEDISQQRGKVRLIAAGPLGCLDRRLAGTTSDSPVGYQPCCYQWSVPLHFQTAFCHQNALTAHSRFSRFWSKCVRWEVCPWGPTPSETQNRTRVTWVADMIPTWGASSSCLNVPGLNTPVCTSLSPPLGHEVPGAHLKKEKEKEETGKNRLFNNCVTLLSHSLTVHIQSVQ